MDNLKDLLSRFNIRADKRFGQNFLSDTNLLDAIVSDSGIGEDSVVLEVGPGLGALTAAIAKVAARVVAVEIDKRLEPPLTELASHFSNLEIIFRDVLKIHPDELMDIMGERFSVVANLPYYITTPLLFYFLENDFPIDSISVMVQKEVALRMTASHNTEDYGALTAAIALHGTAQIMRIVNRQMFFPRPDVDSAIVKITLNDNYKEGKKQALRLIKCAFSMRRKTLVNNIMGGYKITRQECENLLASLSIDPKARGESLTPDQLYRIADLLNYKLQT